MQSKLKDSSPKEAALQGLEKMKIMMDIGIKQIVLPPYIKNYNALIKNISTFKGEDSVRGDL